MQQSQQTATEAELALASLELLNESANDCFALTFNPRNGKWVIVRMQRGLSDNEIWGSFLVTAFAAGVTPKAACRDALSISFAIAAGVAPAAPY